MTGGLYSRLAWGNLKKNQKLYLPYILTGICMVTVFYILGFLADSPQVRLVAGGGTLQGILILGVGVIGIFSALLLFYTSSFVVKQRRRDFGLYNVLGMAKRHIARVMLCENLFVSAACIGGGLVTGIVFSKLAELGLLYVIGAENSFTFSVNGQRILLTVAVYLAIYLLILLNSLRLVRAASPIELLNSSSAGEKEPKANFVLALAGLLLLGAGYWLAVSVQDMVAALTFFFVAVILVILGTYCCFISGSVAFLKLLRRNKKYYYRADHFISTSSMIYRMKRNGAGLATICILSTMVLVMLSSVTCLLVGQEDAIRARYPRNISATLYISDMDAGESEVFRDAVQEVMEEQNVAAENAVCYHYLSFFGWSQDGRISSLDNYSAGVTDFVFVPVEDYNASTGENLTPVPGQVYVCSPDVPWQGSTLTLDETVYQVIDLPDFQLKTGENAAQMISSVYILVPDMQTLRTAYEMQLNEGNGGSLVRYTIGFDTPALSGDAQISLYSRLNERLGEMQMYTDCDSAAANRADFHATFSGLFFLGMILGVAFVLAAVLIMYYKQITEGYEDQARFGIMMRVGMTRQEIRRSVNAQVLTVFFLPLLMAGVHMGFAFPMVQKLLTAFALNNVRLFLLVTLIAYCVFAILYTAVYVMTSRAYYGIVSSAGPNAGVR